MSPWHRADGITQSVVKVFLPSPEVQQAQGLHPPQQASMTGQPQLLAAATALLQGPLWATLAQAHRQPWRAPGLPGPQHSAPLS